MGQRLVIIKLLSANSKKQFGHTRGIKSPIQRCRNSRIPGRLEQRVSDTTFARPERKQARRRRNGSKCDSGSERRPVIAKRCCASTERLRRVSAKRHRIALQNAGVSATKSRTPHTY